MLQDHGAVRIDDESDIEEPVGPVRVARLGLCHDVGAPAAGELPEAVGFRAWNIDGAGPRKLGMVDIENLVIEPLQRTFRYGDEAHGYVKAGQPEGCFGQAFEMLKVLCDVLASAYAPEAGDQSDRGIGFDHAPTLF